MHAILLFLGVWGGYMAFTAASFAVVIWAFSVDDDAQGKKATAYILWAMFWPVVWLYLRTVGRGSVSAERQRRGNSAGELTGITEAGSATPGARRFRTIRESKEYLAGKIAAEAEREGTPLTEVERKMLYFTEIGWTLPDMKAISLQFDRDYEQGEYEQKIGALVGKIQAREESYQASWDQAVDKLSRGDHYLLFLIDAVQPLQRQETWITHSLKVVAAALVLFAIAALDLWFRRWMRDH